MNVRLTYHGTRSLSHTISISCHTTRQSILTATVIVDAKYNFATCGRLEINGKRQFAAQFVSVRHKQMERNERRYTYLYVCGPVSNIYVKKNEETKKVLVMEIV